MALSSRQMCLAILVLACYAMLSSASVRVRGLRANDLKGDALGNKPDPYLKVFCGGTSGGRTNTIRDTSSPSWSAEFSFVSCGPGQTLTIEVWDEDLYHDDRLGTCNHRLSKGSFNAQCSLTKGKLYFTYTAQ